MNKILITGLGRSGTTMLASALGGHSKVTMLNEPQTEAWKYCVGKPYVGIKIALDSNKTGWRYKVLFRKLAYWIDVINPFKTILFYPASEYTLRNYIDSNTKIIIISRNLEDVILSSKNRANISKRKLKFKHWIGTRKLSKIRKFNHIDTSYEKILDNPTKELTNICNYIGIKFEKEMLVSAKYNPYNKELNGN